MRLPAACGLVFATGTLAAQSVSYNTTFTSPMLPGWHSDPSCIFVPEQDNTFFCVTSTFLVTPGLPIFASQNLVDWKIVSHVINRPAQWSDYSNTYQSSNGIYAATLRYHQGIFHVVTTYFNAGVKTLLFTSSNLFDDAAWSQPLNVITIGYDPDLFWDDDGQVYITTTPVNVGKLCLATGSVSDVVNVWNGTGGVYPEGPHVYKKDGYYYLTISEGGTELGHSVTIARSKSILGPYDSFAGNPILTNRNTSEYFQTVGHSDIFQDASGNYWACALSTRSGPEWINYPMGRETVLTSVHWDANEWPVFEPVRGSMHGPLPHPQNATLTGPFVTDPDIVDFDSRDKRPASFVNWRWPKNGSFEVSPAERPGTLKMAPTGELTAMDNTAAGADGLTLMMRVQTHTEFDFSVDFDYRPTAREEESGLTVFLTQEQHLDLGLVLQPSGSSSNTTQLALRMRSSGTGNYNDSVPIQVVRPVPIAWTAAPISLRISAVNVTHYVFSAASSVDRSEAIELGAMPATIVSGGTGRFTGSLVGAYVTKNNGTGTSPSYISRWRYTGRRQKIDN